MSSPICSPRARSKNSTTAYPPSSGGNSPDAMSVQAETRLMSQSTTQAVHLSSNRAVFTSIARLGEETFCAAWRIRAEHGALFANPVARNEANLLALFG